MKNLNKLIIYAAALLCSYGCYEEPSRSLMDLREVGISENNLYSIENLKADGTAICHSLREYKDNGEVIGSMNKGGDLIINLSEKEVNKLKSLKNKLTLEDNASASIKYELIFWDGEANPQEKGFFDGSYGAGFELVEFTKNICQTNWSTPD